MLAKLLLWVSLLSLNQDIHWREGTTLVMLAKLLLWVCLLSLNQDIHWREGTALVMWAKLFLYVYFLLSLNQDIEWLHMMSQAPRAPSLSSKEGLSLAHAYAEHVHKVHSHRLTSNMAVNATYKSYSILRRVVNKKIVICPMCDLGKTPKCTIIKTLDKDAFFTTRELQCSLSKLC